MRKIIFISLFILILLPLHGQNVGLKTNVLYDFTTTFSLGAEIGLSKKTSLDISGAYNPWEFSDVKRMKLWLVQPEFRHWFCERLNGHFLGLHAHAGQYNFSGINFSEKMKNGNYQGNFYGGGISYGYQWILNNRWGLETAIGLGYTHFKYDKYPCAECGTIIKSDTKDYWGPTKASISFIYFIF